MTNKTAKENRQSVPRKIPVNDLVGLTPFQKYKKNEPELILQGSRVIALFNADDAFYSLSEQFNNNVPVNVVDFVQCQREIRAMMLTLRGQALSRQ